MKIGIHDCDNTGFPNLALMKISAAHKAAGNEVTLVSGKAENYDRVIASKVFSFTKNTAPEGSLIGGWGSGANHVLPEDVEHICPDYSLYGITYSMGFLTRGCPNKCSWCIVPEKEGGIIANADVSEFVRHKEVIFLDNNVLAHDHGITQIKKCAELGLKIDFNQGLDALRIDHPIAALLGKCKWLSPLRLACDSKASIPGVANAVKLLRWHNVTPRAYSCYTLIKDVDDALERIMFLKGIGVDPFAQPYRHPDGSDPTRDQRRLARWVNTQQRFKSMTWDEYKNFRGELI